MNPRLFRCVACSFFLFAAVCGSPRPAFADAQWNQPEFAMRYPALAEVGTRSYTQSGVPGDPFNLAFIGSEEDLLRTMAKAGWFPADPITLKSSLRIALDSVARRPYVDAPVSSLYVQGRKQDLAFEQPAAGNPSKRHHVRFWRIATKDAQGRAQWIASTTYDKSIGLSRANGHVTDHVTHHISADVDAERDKLLADMQRAGATTVAWIADFQPEHDGRNGGGDPFHTDGRLVLVAGAAALQSGSYTRP
jgi:hypothetical protein